MNKPAALAVAASALCTIAAILAGCNGPGDPDAKPPADELGTGTRLCDGVMGPATAWENIKNPASANGGGGGPSCNYPPNTPYYSTGLTVVAVDNFDETHDGKSIGDYYVVDTRCNGAPYSGAASHRPSLSPPDLRLTANDVVDASGNETEFYLPITDTQFSYCRTLPQLEGQLSFRFDSTGPVTPVVIPVSDLATYDTARPWFGMLVTVNNLVLSAGGSPYEGRYSANIQAAVPSADKYTESTPVIANILYDIENDGPPLQTGMKFKSVTGVLSFFYSVQLSPRSPADFEK